MAVSIFPRPRGFHAEPGGANSPIGTVHFSGPDAERARDLVAALGGATAAAGAPLEVHCLESGEGVPVRDPLTGARHNEGYTFERRGNAAELRYTHRRGLRNGIASLRRMQGQAELSERFRLVDAPRFAVRGIIEGYYGRPWTQAERLGVLRRIAMRKMNAYVYGPKDDPYHRERWRDGYPRQARDELAELVDQADRLAMDTWYTIGPGLSMEYSRDSDRARLREKLGEVGALGIHSFGLLFDDIPERLQHDADRRAYPTLAAAHAAVSNELFRDLCENDSRTRLVVCPTQYHGDPAGEYIGELGALLDPRIEVMWTGPEICSRELSLYHGAAIERSLHRPTLYWDNYPVNDLEMRYQLHLGPYRGRDPHLYRTSVGVVANVMEHAEAGMIALNTVADYLWNPDDYDPEESFHDSLRQVLGPADYEDFVPFADANRFSALYPSDAPRLAAALEQVGFLRSSGDIPAALRVLDSAGADLARARDLFDRGLENRKLEAEIRPWIAKFAKGLAVLECAREALAAEEKPGAAPASRRLGAEQIRGIVADYRADLHYTFADVLYFLTEDLGREYS